jgi:hypothetical protein
MTVRLAANRAFEFVVWVQHLADGRVELSNGVRRLDERNATAPGASVPLARQRSAALTSREG